MAEAPVPDRPNIQSNASPYLKVPGHADVLIATSRTRFAALNKGSGNDSWLGNLDSPVLGGVERRNTRREHAPSIGSSNKRPQLPS